MSMTEILSIGASFFCENTKKMYDFLRDLQKVIFQHKFNVHIHQMQKAIILNLMKLKVVGVHWKIKHCKKSLI